MDPRLNMETLHDRLPFPVYRIIIEFMGLVPTVNHNVARSLATHFEEKYCKRCGEYITSRQFTLKTPYHLSCRQKFYTPDNENIKYFHFGRISISSLIHGFLGGFLPDVRKCPVMFFSKQPVNYYRMDICTDQKNMLFQRGGAWVRYDYQINQDIVKVSKNDKFTVIPELFSKELHTIYSRPLMLGIHQLMSGINKLDVMERFHVHSIKHILHWILKMYPNELECLHPFQFYALRRLIRNLPDDIQYRCVLSLDPNRLYGIQNRWLQQMLYNFPHMLDHLHERTIQKLFTRYKRWFLKFLDVRPIALHYVTIVYDDCRDNEYDKGNKTNKYKR